MSEVIAHYLRAKPSLGKTSVDILRRWENICGSQDVWAQSFRERLNKFVNRGKRTQGTVRRELNTCLAAVNCVRHDFDTPTMYFKRPPHNPGRERWLTKDEVDAALDAATPEFGDFLRVMFFTGARSGEVSKITLRDIDDTLSHVRLVSKKGETGVETVRYVPIHEAIKPILYGWAKVATTLHRPLLRHPRGMAWTTPLLCSQWQKVRDAVPSLADANLHDIRHSFATHQRMAGTDLQVLGKLLGHKSTQTTQRYAHVGDTELSEAIAKL